MSLLKRALFLLLPPLVLAVWAQISPLSMVPANFPASRFPHVQIVQSLVLSFDKIDGEKFFGISALAYDPQTRILYMLSDRSRLFAFDLILEKGKIKVLKPRYARRLRDRYGRRFFLRKSDSEGMSLVTVEGKKRLLISFEHHPRVMLFDLHGKEVSLPKTKSLADLRRELSLTQLPPVLRDVHNYRSGNKMLESVTYDPKRGMITTPEFPLRTTPDGLHGIYNRKGRICYIRRGEKEMAITELERLSDGNLLALERGVHLGKPLRVDLGLLRIDLKHVEKGICRTEALLSVSTDDGWALDNFEGLTALGDGRYLMVSDDNDNFFQQTILVLFRLR